MKKNNRLTINLMAILIILVVSIGISDLLSKSFRNKAYSSNEQPAFVTERTGTREPEDVLEIYIPEGVDEIYEPEEDYSIYRSEDFTRSIIEDLSLTKEEEEKKSAPRIAFIIDDMGYETDVAEKMINLDFPLTLSILPFLQYSQYIAEQGNENNKEIMLHMPMEAKNATANPGPGAIKSNMSEEEIKQKVKECLKSVPNIIGMNNHMGSKITENETIMKIIFEEIKQNNSNLYFVDSKTTQNSIAYDLAIEMGMDALERTVFLDNDDNIDYIKGQLMEAKDRSIRNGQAVVIGHDRINTYYVLKRFVPEIEKEGIEIVFVSSLINSCK